MRGMGETIDGQWIAPRSDSRRPPHYHPKEWHNFDPAKRLALTRMYEQRIATERLEDARAAKEQGREPPAAPVPISKSYQFYLPTPTHRLPNKTLIQSGHRRSLPFTLPSPSISLKDCLKM